MGIDMFLNDARQQASSVQTMCKAHINDMEKIKTSINEFVNEEALKGKTYDSAKQYFNKAYISLANGIILLAETIIKAQSQFIDRYIGDVDCNSLQSEVLERQIQMFEYLIRDMENVQMHNPVIMMNTKSIMSSYDYQLRKIKEKLDKLLTFNSSSVAIFAEIEGLLADVQRGLLEVSSGKAWIKDDGVFMINAINMDWSININKKYSKAELDKIINKIPNLTSEDFDKIREYAKQNPEEEVPQSLIDYVKENKDGIFSDLKNDVISNGLEQSGLGIMKFGGWINTLGGKAGPVGEKSFVLVNPKNAEVAAPIIKNGKYVNSAGKVLGKGFIAAGFGMGMYDDLKNNNKTVGQAVTHNVTSTAAGIGGCAAGGALAAIVLGTNPVGWAALGTAAITMGVGIGVSRGFDYIYKNNMGDIQNKLDSVGEKIDDTLKSINEGFNKAKKNIGEAISDARAGISPVY